MERSNRFAIDKTKPEMSINKRIKDERTQQRRENRNRLVESNRNLTPNETFTVPEPEKGKNIHKLLDIWRKQKEEKLKAEKAKQKPVFKVSSASTSDLSAKKSTFIPTVSRNQSISTTTPASVVRPMTRSVSKKINQSCDQVQTANKPTNVNTFGSKFTFQATLYDKKQNKPIKLHREPAPQPIRQITKKPTNDLKSTNKTKATTTASTEAKKVESRGTLSLEQVVAPVLVKYEEFSANLFVKYDDKFYENDPLNSEMSKLELDDDVSKKVKWSTGCESKVPAKKSSYRKSKSGVYTINMQSSILEFDEDNSDMFKLPPVPVFDSGLARPVVEQVASSSYDRFTQNPQQTLEHVENKVAEKPSCLRPNENSILTDQITSVETVVIDAKDQNADDEVYVLDGERRDVKFYRNLIIIETKNLNDISSIWENRIIEAPEDVQGEIRSSIGLAKLLIDERFSQFADLVSQCEFKTGDMSVKCSDLQGFWDMVDYQVVDVKKKFAKLDQLRLNNYVVQEIATKMPNKKQVVVAKATTVTKKQVKSNFAAFKAQMLKAKFLEGDVPNLCTIEDQENRSDPQNPIRTVMQTPNKSPLKCAQLNLVVNETKPSMKDVDEMKHHYKPQTLDTAEDDDDLYDINAFRITSFRASILLKNPANCEQPTTPKTPRQQARKSLLCSNLGDIHKSPLLKLAYISSHGKRLSRNGIN